MSQSRRTARRGVVGLIGSGATAGALLLWSAPSAFAQPPPPPAPPGCSAADLAQVSGQVGTAMSAYLFAHPDVNDMFTSLRGKPNEEIRSDVQEYLNANPQVESEVNGIRQPLTDLRSRCQ
jgi:hemophore-related protein